MLTFEKIRELERVERTSKKLQKLPESVVDELREYIQKKEKMSASSADIIELENVKSTIKRFFELREQKLVASSLDAVRTGMPPENIAAHEEKVFYQLVDMVRRFRETFFEDLRKDQQGKEVFYKVKKTLPEFVGPDMKTYQLKENDVITLPKELEELLLKQDAIEKVQ